MVDFEALDQTIADLESGLTGGEALVTKVLADLAVCPTRWQWVVQGDTSLYRMGVVEHLCGKGQFKKAKRIACCGRGDKGYMQEEGNGVKVKAMCCGFRACPRCSRRFGRRVLRKVEGHLSQRPHGAIDHVVLTQKVVDGEPLPGARDRFEKKWKKMYRSLKELGFRSMLVTWHVKRTRMAGWHYHAHLVIEWPDGVSAEDKCLAISEAWRCVVAKAEEPTHPVFYRHVAPEGAALTTLAKDGQSEFWAVSPDPIGELMQYCVRDVVQGIESWVEGVEGGQLIEEFMQGVADAKLHRLYGQWRDAVVEVEEAEEESGKDPEKATDETKGEMGWLRLGSMDAVIKEAKEGITACREFLKAVASNYSNKSGVSVRLDRVCHFLGL
jgi:hypothetical protein